jgi:multiple sugar transport system substrate-binding protein
MLPIGIAAGTGVSSATTRVAAAAPSGSLTIWVDSARVAQAKAYIKAFPNVKVNLVTYDGGANGSGSLESKVALFNRVGKGWPDVVFSAEANDVQKLGVAPFNFPATLNQGGLLPKNLLKNFATGALNPCYIGKNLECLRNDMAFDVLWVNVPLMKQFGYTVPTTWQQWQTIGEDVAKNHPGYIIGELGNSYDDAIYLQAAQCHMNDLINPTTLLDNPADPNCVNMAKLLDPLLADGSVPATNVFGSTFGKQYAGKVLMTVGPAWYDTAIFEGSGSVLNSPKGTFGAYPPLSWNGGKAYTGDVGGGLWIMSSHSANPSLAAQALVWLATSTTSQGLSQGYPAYIPAAGPWIAAQDASGLFAAPLAPAFATAAPEVWTGWSETPWDAFGIWASTATPNLVSGQSVSSQLSAVGAAFSNYAQSAGYQVVTK